MYCTILEYVVVERDRLEMNAVLAYSIGAGFITYIRTSKGTLIQATKLRPK